jgi:Kdo2-lipid IVA lauroyltransferase/acyltransferase
MSAPPATSSRASDAPAPPGPGLRALGRVPLPLMYALAALLALLLRYVFRFRLAVARDNLRRALPELDQRERERLLNRQYQKLTEVLLELPWLAVATPEQIRARVALPNLATPRADLDAGRPVLVLAAHLSNWEWLLQALGVYLDVQVFAAYKPPHSARADRLMLALRSARGVRMVPAKRLIREILRQRGAPHLLGMVADQMPTSSAGRVWLRFLGRDTAFFPGPAEVARLGNYRAYFAAQRRVRRGCYEVHFEALNEPGEVLDVPSFTQRYAARVEALVREQPAEWAWTHRRWKLQPPPPPPPAPVARP